MNDLLVLALALTVLGSSLNITSAQEVPPAPTAPMMPDPTADPPPPAPPSSTSDEQKAQQKSKKTERDTKHDNKKAQPKK